MPIKLRTFIFSLKGSILRLLFVISELPASLFLVFEAIFWFKRSHFDTNMVIPDSQSENPGGHKVTKGWEHTRRRFAGERDGLHPGHTEQDGRRSHSG